MSASVVLTDARSVPERRVASRRRPRVPVVRGIATGAPDHEYTQDEVRAAATEGFPGVERSAAMLDVFDNAQISTRRFAQPIDWYLQPHGFGERNAAYVEAALELGERIARQAMWEAGVGPDEIDAVLFVSSTGVSTPSLDATLVQRLGIDLGVARLPLWGLGCAGGAAGLARAADLVRAGYDHVLLLAVEFCSLTFVVGDESKSNFIGTALFADGGAALVLGAEGEGQGPGVGGAGGRRERLRIVHAHSGLVPDTASLTGWDVADEGLRLRLSKDIPAAMGTALRPLVDASLAGLGWTLEELDHVIVHPGGAKVITGYELALGLDDHALDATRAVLRRHGNMSSPTVLFVLEEALRRGATGRGLISASGPGFAIEHLLVEFA